MMTLDAADVAGSVVAAIALILASFIVGGSSAFQSRHKFEKVIDTLAWATKACSSHNGIESLSVEIYETVCIDGTEISSKEKK